MPQSDWGGGFGKTADEVRAEGTEGPLVAARTFAGNKPTTSIFAPAIEGDDAALGAQDASTQALIAYYRANRK